MSACCRSCRFWRLEMPSSGDKAAVGYCLHDPPSAVLVAQGEYPWILTSHDAWCGEHELVR